jgi:hypothetical protein
MFNKNDCSLSNKKSKFSCYDKESLQIIAKNLNKIGYNINIDKDDKTIYNNISKILKQLSNCKDESCWLTWNKLINNLNKSQINKLKSNFKPLMPEEWRQNMHTWLTSIDIDNALNQYVKSGNSFYSYGAVPIDANKKDVCYNKLCTINLKNHINNGINKIGIIFNTDEHSENGEHWIGYYIDINGINNKKKPGIYFFDSVGDKPPEEINKLTGLIINQGKKMGINFEYFYNQYQHQKGSSECGIYCLHFIDSMINKENFESYIKKKKNDNYINKYRKIFFVD